jgi:hypothetical protein
MRIIIVLLSLFLLFCTFGCLGYGEGYNDKAKEYTSADYTIQTYKDFIAKYNSICNVGSSIDEYQAQINDFDSRTRGQALSYSESSERSRLISVKSGYVSQYNRLSSEYNTMAMDKTQDWLKIASLPERVDSYSDGDHLTNNNQVSDKIF